MSYPVPVSLSILLLVLVFACVSTTSPPPRNLVEATSTTAEVAGVPEEESIDPTIIASPPENLVDATRTTAEVVGVPEEESIDPTIIASPPQNLVEATRVLALIEGILAEENDCLRITESGTGGDAIVWQKEVFGIERRRDAVLIVDLFGSNGQPSPTVIWRLGDEISAAGRVITSEGADEHAGAGFSEKCPGPYWMVSRVQ